MYICIIAFVLFFAIELLYFKIADKYNIIDHPNHRSSHSEITIRGGGIIFSIGLLLSPFYIGLNEIYFFSGLFLISLVSFIDDVKTISSGVRITVHLIAVGLLFYQLGVYSLAIYAVLFGFIFVIGTINAINFMDGINGITGGYGLITLLSLYVINSSVNFASPVLLLTAIIAVIVFNFFNFRKKAQCFAGDVGSVSLAFIIMFFLLQLIIKTADFKYILLLLLYGLDTVTTILFRLLRKENISEAHRSHFYQYLANEKKIPHLIIAATYAGLQLIINGFVVLILPSKIAYLIITVISAITLFILARFMVEGKARLVKTSR